jgi:hypothetical protein
MCVTLVLSVGQGSEGTFCGAPPKYACDGAKCVARATGTFTTPACDEKCGPPPPSKCEAAEARNCQAERGKGSMPCLECCGHHEAALTAAGCDEAAFELFCKKSGPPPAPPPPPGPAPPPGPLPGLSLALPPPLGQGWGGQCDGNVLMIRTGARDDKVGLGRIVALYTAHPLHPKFANIFGASFSETTMRPNPTTRPRTTSSCRRWSRKCVRARRRPIRCAGSIPMESARF